MLDKKEELTQELRRARTWIIAVGIIFFAFSWILYSIQADGIPSSYLAEARAFLWKITGSYLGFSIAMFFLAKYKPVLGCVLALVGFWMLQFYVASQPGNELWHGMLIKIFFTLALIKGIKSAARAQTLQSELGQVFE